MKRLLKGVISILVVVLFLSFSNCSILEVCADTASDGTTETVTEAATEAAKTDYEQGIKIRVGDKKKFTRKIKGKFSEKNGLTVFTPADKKTFKGGFFTVGKRVYHSNKKGILDKGWKKIKGHYYHFDRKNGQMAMSATVESIKVDKLGTAKETDSTVARINTYISARKIMEKVTKPSDSKADKLYKCYKWVEALPYNQYRTFEKGYAEYKDDWDVVFANDIFKNRQGCCVSESAALAFLAKECGYEDVYVCSDTGHAWAKIDGRLYDPLFAEAKSFADNYNAPFTDYRSNAAYKKKI